MQLRRSHKHEASLGLYPGRKILKILIIDENETEFHVCDEILWIYSVIRMIIN